MSRPFRFGVIFTHPTQHHSPLWQRLAKEPDLEIHVMYLSSENTNKGTGDRELGVKEPWDVDLLSGYKYEFLKNWNGQVSPLVKSSLICPSLNQRLKKKNIDAVWLSSFVTWSHRVAFLLCKLRGITIISQNDGTIMSDTGYYNSAQQVMRSMLYPFLYRLSDYWMPIGNHNEIYLRRYGVDESKMFPAPYPFDRKRFVETIGAQEDKIQEIREKYKWTNETVLFGFAAKWIERKSPLDFIDAIKIAHQKNQNIRGLLIGGGVLEGEIDKRLATMNGEVVKVGFVNQNQLPLYYAAMDVFTCPSKVDSHPLVVSEAMASGCPVILSDRCGNWGYSDIVQHKYNGIVYPWGNIEKFSEAILELADKEVRACYSQRAKEIAATQDLEVTAKNIMALVEKIKKSKCLKS